MKDTKIHVMKETELEKSLRFKLDTTDYSMNDAYRRVARLGKRFADVTVNSSFTREKRLKMLTQMISYFEGTEEYEKCFVLSEINKYFHNHTSE